MSSGVDVKRVTHMRIHVFNDRKRRVGTIYLRKNHGSDSCAVETESCAFESEGQRLLRIHFGRDANVEVNCE